MTIDTVPSMTRTTTIIRSADSVTTNAKRYNLDGEHVGLGPWMNVVWACNDITALFTTPEEVTVDGIPFEVYDDVEIAHSHDGTVTIRATTPFGREVLNQALNVLNF